MSDAPSVSIVTPLYNSTIYIARTITSVQEQTFIDWEYIIVDDASTDNGADIVEKFAKDDSRIHLIRLNENSGAGVSRNTGIQAAQGRYIAFIDSDDIWESGKLERQLQFMADTEAVFTFTDYRKINEDGVDLDHVVKCKDSLTYKTQLKTNFVGCSTVIYDTSYYGKRYFPLIRKRQDFGLWLDLLKAGKAGMGLSEPLTKYTVRKSGLSGRKLELVRHNWVLYKDVLGFGPIRSAYYLGWNIFIKILGRR